MNSKPFLERIDGPMAWRSADLAGKASLSRRLDAGHLDDLDRYLERTRGKSLQEITLADAQSPRIADFMRGAQDEVLNGRGAVIITGCDFERYTREQFERISWMLSLCMGIPISQSVFGELIAHVRAVAHNPSGRSYRTTQELIAHTDTPDALALMCIQTAKEGGLSTAVSALAIHNELLRHHPEHLAPLYRGFPYYRVKQELPGEPPVSPYNVPVFCQVDGVVSCMYVRHLITNGAKALGIPLPEDLERAMDCFDKLAVHPDLAITYAFERGDIQFVNNRTLLHSRTEFVDCDEPDLKRDLMRLWIDMPNGRRPTVPEMDPYQQPLSGGRGGVMAQPDKAAA